jgi:antitoxin VapB
VIVIDASAVVAIHRSTRMLELAEDTEKLIQLVAEKTGKTPEAVVRESVEVTARAAGVKTCQQKLSREDFIAGMKAIADRCAKRPVLDRRTPDEIIGYDEFGVPQ